ncbi:hypothetical protein ABZR86_02695 [Dyella marensis]|uniref:HicB family protein n=1 Tax=Dyella marensis TaxID=500610 RepID=A0A1I1ZWL2_9GAMM|nr:MULTISPECIES: hypothetical protein [Dyella]SFE35979.1 hypothetical protein SAMN02799615_00836 [Dyella marensis]
MGEMRDDHRGIEIRCAHDSRDGMFHAYFDLPAMPMRGFQQKEKREVQAESSVAVLMMAKQAIDEYLDFRESI